MSSARNPAREKSHHSRFKILIIGLAGALGLSILLAVIYVATFDDDDYKRLLIGIVERRTGYKVDIRGDFSFEMSTLPRLSASDIVFRQLPGGRRPPVQHIGQLRIQLAVRPLLTGDILVKHLEINDMTIAWVLGEDAEKSGGRPWSADNKSTTIPMFEDVDLRNIRASISNRDGSRIDEIVLERFDIDDVKGMDRLRVTGEGSVNDNVFLIEGLLGSLADAMERARPYPIELNFRVADFFFNISGTIDDVTRGDGLNVRLVAEEAELATLLNILKADSSPVGGLNLYAMVTGDIGAPRVSELAIRIGDEAAPRFTAQGAISNARTGEGTDIQVTASIKNKAIIQWLLGEGLFDLNAVRLEGTFRETGGAIFLEDTVVEASGDFGLSVSGEGTMGFGDPFQKPWVDEIDAMLSFSSPTTESLMPLLSDLFPDLDTLLPELGPVTGKARLIGFGERLSLEEIAVTAEQPSLFSVSIRGRIGRIEVGTESPASDVEVLISLRAETTSALSSAIGKSLPDLGPIAADGRIYDDNGTWRMDDLNIHLGSEQQLQLTATGKIASVANGDDLSLEGIDLLVSFRSPNTEAVSQLIRQQLPDIGAIEGKLRVSGNNTQLAIEEARLSANSADGLRISADGTIGSVTLGKGAHAQGINFALTVTAPDCAPVERICGIELPDLGPVDMKARVSGDDDNIDIKGIELRCGPAESPTLSARGDIRGVGSKDNVSLNTVFATQSRPWIELVRQSAPEDIQVAGKVELSGSFSNCRIDTLEISTKGEERLSLAAYGKAENIGGAYDIDVHVTAKASATTAINSIAGTSLPSLGPVSINGRLSGNAQKSTFDGKVLVGKTEFVTKAVTTIGGERPQIQVKNTTSKLYLEDFGISPEQPPDDPGQTTGRPEPRKGYLFRETPLPFDYLRLADVDWDLDAEEVIGGNFALKNLDLDFLLSNGILRTTAGKVTYTEGYVTSELMIDASNPTPVIRLKFSADDIDISDILGHLHRPLLLDGRLTVFADLQSAGATPRELASALNGEFGFAIEDGKISRSANLLAADALDLIITIPAMTAPNSRVPGTKKYVDLNCMALRFLFKDGVGESEVIFLDTRDLRIRGAGSIDFRSETIDLVIAPQSKKRRLSMTSSVRISGPLANPSKRKIPLQEAAQLAGEVLAPYIFLPTRALGSLWYLIGTDKDRRAPCQELYSPTE